MTQDLLTTIHYKTLERREKTNQQKKKREPIPKFENHSQVTRQQNPSNFRSQILKRIFRRNRGGRRGLVCCGG